MSPSKPSRSRVVITGQTTITEAAQVFAVTQAENCGFTVAGPWQQLDDGHNDCKAATAPLVANNEQATWQGAQTFEAFDLNWLPESISTRLPQMAVFDMDSTLIAIECIDELAKAAGVGAEVSAITAAAMRGELDFAESFTKRLGTLRGLPVSVADELAANLPLMAGVEQAIADLHTWGCKIVIASGGFTHMANVLGKRLGAHAVVANQLEIVDDQLTGQHIGQIVTGEVKKQVLEERAAAWGIKQSRTIAVGDGANDLHMIGAAATGIAAHAKPAVCAAAPLHITNTGLEALRYLLGWSDDAMAES